MQLSELKLVSASNIIRLRQGAGLTQAELGAKLNYSDKTISKWERGEAIPDAYTLTVIAGLFDVTVDYLLSSHDQWQSPPPEPEEDIADGCPPQYSASLIIILVMVSVWTAALTAFVVLWIFGIVYWQIFAIALPVSLLVLTILEACFYRKRNLQFFISGFVLSLFLMLFFLFFQHRLWQLFLVALPSLAIVFLACNLRKKTFRWHRNDNK